MTDLALRPAGGALLLAPADVAACRRWIAHHSKSFYLSSLLLPRRVREPAWALYAFCRRADDAVDEAGDGEPLARVEALRRRLDAVTRGQALDHPIDRAYAVVAARYDLPAAVAGELIAGMEMDARGTRYRTWDDLGRYCFRVASTVGLMMTRIMGWSRHDAFLRAADLGAAMQLTNIARDVGEDARRGRVYLPDELLDQVGTSADEVRHATVASPPIREAVRQLLDRARLHYRAADRGLPLLPRSCRLAIASARHIYAAIGADLARHGHDSITRRAHTTLAGKLLLVVRALPSLVAAPAPPAPGPWDELFDPLITAAGLDLPRRAPRRR